MNLGLGFRRAEKARRRREMEEEEEGARRRVEASMGTGKNRRLLVLVAGDFN